MKQENGSTKLVIVNSIDDKHFAEITSLVSVGWDKQLA